MWPRNSFWFQSYVTLRLHLWAACSFCGHNPWIPVTPTSAQPVSCFTLSIHLDLLTVLIRIFFPPNRLNKIFQSWREFISRFLARGYYQSLLLVHFRPHTAAASAFSISCSAPPCRSCYIEQKKFSIMSCPVSVIDELVWMVLLYVL